MVWAQKMQLAVTAVTLAWMGSKALAAGFEESVIPETVASDGTGSPDANLADEPWITSGSINDGASGMLDCENCPQDAECQPGSLCDTCDAPYGMVNRLIDNKHACWTFRTEALLMWRNAPPSQPLFLDASDATVLNANQLNSPGAAGPRFSIFRTDGCGDAIEVTYFRVANWHSQKSLPSSPLGYSPTFINIPPVDSVTTSLGASLQSFELNGRMTVLPMMQLLGGFRWFQWGETFQANATTAGAPAFDTIGINCINDLYGYQIGFDSLLLSTNWLRVEGLMKGGAYYNRARQATSVVVPLPPDPPYTAGATVGGDTASFVGELGITGVMPISRNIDFRVGYLALWVQGLTQPTNVYRKSPIDPSTVPFTAPTLDMTGSTVLQGLTMGLEGRW